MLPGQRGSPWWLQSYNIISLYLLGNLVTTTHTLPILFGLIPGKWAERIVTPFTAIFGCWVGFAAVVVYAALQRHSWGLSLSAALHQVSTQLHLPLPLGLPAGASACKFCLQNTTAPSRWTGMQAGALNFSLETSALHSGLMPSKLSDKRAWGKTSCFSTCKQLLRRQWHGADLEPSELPARLHTKS